MSESADALGYMALAGWDAEQSISALPGVLDLAAASEMGLAEASDMVTDYLSAFGEEADQAGRMADVLAYAQANSNTTTQQLGLAFKNCAVNANAFGLDIEQTTALLGKLGDQGLKGSEAGTALNAVFRDMSSKMKDGAIAIGETNVKITDANGNFLSMVEIIEGVQKATDGLSESEKMVALQSTFTADSIKAMGILMNTGAENIGSFTDALYNSEGAASKMASTMQDNLKGSIDNMKSAFEAVMITIGEKLIPIFRNLVDEITNLLTWFNNLSPSIQNVIIAVGGFLALLGPGLMLLGSFISNLGLMATGLMTLTGTTTLAAAATSAFGSIVAFITGPIGLAIAAITALIAIGVALYKNWDTIKAKCKEIWEGSIKPVIQNVTNTVSNVIKTVWNAISSFLSGCWNGLTSICKTVWNAISNTVSTVTNTIRSTIQTVFSAISSIISTITNTWKSIISSIWNGIKSVFSNATSNISSNIQTTFSAISSIISTISGIWVSNVQARLNEMKSIVTFGVNAVKTVISTVWSGIQTILVAPFQAAQSVISGILSGITSAINKVTSAISSVKSSASNVVDKLNPFKKSIEFVYSQEEGNINTRFRSDAINLARDLVYSDRTAKTSIAESVSNVAKSASSMIKGSNGPDINPGNSVVINNTYNSPKPASIIDLKKQDAIQMRRLSMQLGF